ncbi:MAG TPA: DUF423 domain-containing protein [Burkholderiaceae bacterium]|nr:DUF423 domain-containing protein [Burkholderiaceae bacterium]
MLGVGTGAFGAHGLRAHVGPDMLAVWQTAVLYQFVHALGLLAVAALSSRLHPRLASWATLFLLAGILIFSGSLYALVLSDVRALGAITPIGGVSFMIGWALLAWAAVRGPKNETR